MPKLWSSRRRLRRAWRHPTARSREGSAIADLRLARLGFLTWVDRHDFGISRWQPTARIARLAKQAERNCLRFVPTPFPTFPQSKSAETGLCSYPCEGRECPRCGCAGVLPARRHRWRWGLWPWRAKKRPARMHLPPRHSLAIARSPWRFAVDPCTPLLGLLGEILTNPGGFANLRALLPCGYQSLSTRARAKAKAGLQLVEILHGTGARATRIAASSAWSGGGLGSTGLGRNREHWQLRDKLRTLALGAGGLFLAIHQGLEMVVTDCADVLKNGHCFGFLHKVGSVHKE